MSLALLGIGRREAGELGRRAKAALLSCANTQGDSMRLPASSRAGSTPCLQGSFQHPHYTGSAAGAWSPTHPPAAPMISTPASGCESNFAQPARGMHVACTSNSSIETGKASKGSRSSPPTPNFQTDLGQIKGVGPVNEGLLISQGVNSVRALTNVYRGEANSNSQEMMKYLQGKVGIKFKRHCQAITDHVRLLAPAHSVTSSAGVTLCVEGNISAGKSTFLNLIEKTINNGLPQPQVSVVPEPVDTWQNLQGGGNILDAFYRDPHRYAYTFQNYVFLTRCMQESNNRDANLRLLERSVFSDRMVFVKAVHESKYMSDLELSVYNSWFDPMVKDILPSIVPDGFIYLRADPTLCSTRMAMRNRSEEAGVPLEYLQKLHDKHEDWLGPDKGSCPWANWKMSGNQVEAGHLLNQYGQPVSSQSILSVPPDLTPFALKPPPLTIKDAVVRLTQGSVPTLHDTIVDTPALVLDCGPDLRNDRSARQDFADKVRTYYEWVRACKERASMEVARNAIAEVFDGKQEWSARKRPFLSDMMWPDKLQAALLQYSDGNGLRFASHSAWNGHNGVGNGAEEPREQYAMA